MIYGKDKALTMARSLLPSRSYGSRTDKAELKRAARHSIRQELHKLIVDPDYYDDSWVDYDAYPEHDIREVVYDRRGADKTHPFERWAEAITKDVNQDSRLTHIKSLVPEGVIGDHAITHLEWKDHFSTEAELQLEENIRLNREEGKIRNRYTRNKPEKHLTYEEEIAVLRKIVEDGRLHRDLNSFMGAKTNRRRPTESVRREFKNEETGEYEFKYVSVYLPFPPSTVKIDGPRKLLGMHDVETFYKDVRYGFREPEVLHLNGNRYANPKAFRGGYEALYAFLSAVHYKKKLPRALPFSSYLY